MPIFRRDDPVVRVPSDPDPELRALEADEAGALRRLVRTEFAERGREVTVHGDHVTDDAGHAFGLVGLAGRVAGRAIKDWAAIVREHVDRVLAPAQELEGLAPEELREMIRLQLVDASDLPDRARFRSLVPLTDDLTALLAVDLPDSVAVLAPDKLAAYGKADELASYALGRLHERARTDDRLEKSRVGSGPVWVRRISSPSYFTAAFALVLDQVITRFEKSEVTDLGVLVAVPTRHVLYYRILDGTGGMDLVSLMLRSAHDEYDAGPGSIRPELYWVRGDQWTRITRRDPSGRLSVDIDAPLTRALGMGV